MVYEIAIPTLPIKLCDWMFSFHPMAPFLFNNGPHSGRRTPRRSHALFDADTKSSRPHRVCGHKNLSCDARNTLQNMYNVQVYSNYNVQLYKLVGGLEHVLFSHICTGNVIIPIDRGVGIPPTRFLCVCRLRCLIFFWIQKTRKHSQMIHGAGIFTYIETPFL